MKPIAFTTAAAIALTMSATAGLAGNLDDTVLTTAPTAPVFTPAAQPDDWTGFYAGGSLGFGDVSNDSNSFDDDGVTYGILGGYDYDFGTFVLGGELEISGFDASGGGTDVDSIFRAKVRAGYDAGDYLPYITAGIAQLDSSGLISGNDTGAVYGFGLDYSLSDDLRLGGEVLQHEFDNFNGTGEDYDATSLTIRLAYEF